MKNLVASFFMVFSVMLLISCGKSDNNNAPVNNGLVNYGPIPTCPAGTIWNGATCTNGNGIAPYQGISRYYDYNRFFQQTAWGVGTQNGDLVISNAAGYQQFLKEAMAVCSRNIWGFQAGLSDCANWVSGSFQIEFSIDGSLRPSVTFTAYPAPSYFNYFLNFGLDGGGAAFNPLVLNSGNTFSLINNSKGFEIRAQGSYWNGGGLRLIQIQVLTGTLNDGYFTYDLYYPFNNVATKIASGRFKRR